VKIASQHVICQFAPHWR